MMNFTYASPRVFTLLHTISFHCYRLADQEFVSQEYFAMNYWELTSQNIHYKSLYNFTVFVKQSFGNNSAVFEVVADENISKFYETMLRCALRKLRLCRAFLYTSVFRRGISWYYPSVRLSVAQLCTQ